MGFVDDAPRQHFETRAQWREWLEANHASSTGVFFVYWRAGTGKPAIGYEAMVEEALCFGWIDSRQSKLDQERTMLWFTPRKRGSGWARPNKLRVEKLMNAGLMHPAGLAVIHAAQQDGSWDVLDSVEDLEIPTDLAEALAAYAGAAAEFDAFPRSVRRGILEWITTAKTAGTRSRRITETAQKAARGERANQWTRKPSPRGAGTARN
ncbi:MAG TPA: YdeI/OmpD-associated family protein [Glaciihabitans sp.]|jgi:uncharacterized protein YdeI (YjbR/CyaY-like superfamily)|nr:YdeI/OmpD-associated family protein [Glaciihabitans sp.]